jgi:hypothetical protein
MSRQVYDLGSSVATAAGLIFLTLALLSSLPDVQASDVLQNPSTVLHSCDCDDFFEGASCGPGGAVCAPVINCRESCACHETEFDRWECVQAD